MAQSPVAVLAIIGIYVAFFAVFESATATTTTATTYGLDSPSSVEEPSSGFFDVLASIIHTVFSFVTTIINALLFNVDGAPPYIQVPVAIIIISSLTWSVVTLIRGN